MHVRCGCEEPIPILEWDRHTGRGFMRAHKIPCTLSRGQMADAHAHALALDARWEGNRVIRDRYRKTRRGIAAEACRQAILARDQRAATSWAVTGC